MSLRPLHTFIRNSNVESDIYFRIANRYNLNNTLTYIPSQNKQLYLIGSLNTSTRLALRTKNLIKKLQPQTLYVQASKQWWDIVKHFNVYDVQQFESQNQMNKFTFNVNKFQHQTNPRGIIFFLKYYSWLLTINAIFAFPSDFKFLTPGLQIYFALKQAQKLNCQIIFGNEDFDDSTIDALIRQTRLYFTSLLFNKMVVQRSMRYQYQLKDLQTLLSRNGSQAFAQSTDNFRINWIIAYFNKIAPKQKKILIDQRDQQIMKQLYTKSNRKILAIINQWHVPGVQHYWRRQTKTLINNNEDFNILGDMDIDSFQEDALVNQKLRQFLNELTHTQPATWQNYLTMYTKENYECQRNRQVHPLSHKQIKQIDQK